MAVTAYPKIIFDASGGTNAPDASGAGPSVALTGTAANTDGTKIYLDGSPDLSGVATDGSHVLYLEDTRTNNRRWAAINAADNTAKTVDVEQTYTANNGPLNWAIGGELKDLTSSAAMKLWNNNGTGNAGAQWSFGIRPAEQVLTTNLIIRGLGDSSHRSGWRFYGEGGEAHISMNRPTNFGFEDAIQVYGTDVSTSFYDIYFESNGTAELAGLVTTNSLSINGCKFHFERCRFKAFRNSKPSFGFEIGVGFNGSSFGRDRLIYNFVDCHFKYFNGPIRLNDGTANQNSAMLRDCYFQECMSGSDTYGNRLIITEISGCIFDRCGTSSIPVLDIDPATSNGQKVVNITNCTFYQSSGDDIKFSNEASGSCVYNCISMNSGGYFINQTDGWGPNLQGKVDYNLVYNPSSGKFNAGIDNSYNVWASNDPTPADPLFTDASNGDFSLQTGSPAIDSGAPETNIGADVSSTLTYPDLGASQREERGGNVPQIIRPSIINTYAG